LQKENLPRKKKAYLSDLIKKQSKKAEKVNAESGNPIEADPPLPVITTRAAKSKKKKVEDDTPTRGVETLFRLTSKNHMDMSAMADSKAWHHDLGKLYHNFCCANRVDA
jgi:hypothetical protein